MTERVSASSFELARKCVYPWTSGLAWDKGKPRWNTRIGTAAHDAIEHMDKSRIAKNPDLSKRQIEVCSGIFEEFKKWSDAYVPPASEREVAFAIDASSDDFSVRKAPGPRGEHRDYSWAPAGDFTCTVDLYYPDWRFDFIDLKTGWMAKPPEESWQMKFIGVAVAGHKKKDSVECAILRVREDGFVVWPATFSDFTLDLTRQEMRRVHLAVKAGDGPSPGDHCKYCPIKTQCKEYKKDE